ncbi:MAG: CinA family protein [Deltaproteobacteria bacterium]|nr:MAG: CinA family protein [Deltaproteobacteria bacterium]
MSVGRSAPEPEPAPLAATLFFPLSGDPVGFNHFAAAESILRAEPALERVVFILSNGLHPDPKKPGLEAPPDARREILETAAGSVADPERSTLARQAQLAGDRLRIDAGRIQISTREFGSDRAVRAAETAAALRRERSDAPGAIHWYAGSDLVRRMADPAIFDDDDLTRLARECVFHVLDRAGESAASAAAAVERVRGVRVQLRSAPPRATPAWLAFFLRLSSTQIRRAAAAGDPLEGMLPADAAERIRARALYRAGRAAARLIDPSGAEIAVRSELALDLERLEAEVAARAAQLAVRLDARREAGRPHTLAVLETSAGGLITAALARRSGASRYFRQARFAYDQTAKANLIGAALDGRSAVSEEVVTQLACALRREADTDFAIAESGMAGPPDGRHRSLRSGECWLACATPSGAYTDHIQLHPFATRREHQLQFSLRAITWLGEVLG